MADQMKEYVHLAWQEHDEHFKLKQLSLTQLCPDFIIELQKLGEVGQKKYNQPWANFEYIHNRDCLTHIYEHLNQYEMDLLNDITEDVEGHLLSIAFNAMMEWWYQKQLKEKENG